NEPVVQFASAAYATTESRPSVVVGVRRYGPATGTATVRVTATGGTATNGADYAFSPVTVTFLPGQISQTFTLGLLGDTRADGARTIVLGLDSPSGAALGSPSSTTVSIADDDVAGTLQFAAAYFSRPEDAGTATITVTRTNGLASEATVDYTTSDGTAVAGTDYTATSGTLTFGAGVTTRTFTVPIADNGVAAPSRSVNLLLSNPGGGARLGAQSAAALWIVDGY
ncbi:MAG TPA: Calx-beta domain-containing protein, partial [Methylomirabilota bacterium]|nr:Calx-beta domain-containing protein [Methylomirabilota bacterium]